MNLVRTNPTNRPELFSRCRGVLAIAAVLALSTPAPAVVLFPITLSNTSVPANGVLHFPDRDGLTVRILAADGSEVSGRFVAPGVWRPDEPFAVGTYTADITYDTGNEPVEDATFEVTPAVELSNDTVHVVVSTGIDADTERILEEECCLAGEAQSPDPCDGPCPPLCVPTVYEAKQMVSVNHEALDEPISWQLDVREVTALEEGEFTLGYWEVTGAPDELCGVVEVFSWLDESTTTLRECIPNSKPELKPVTYPVSGFGVDGGCTIPPLGYEELWCEERRYLCADWLSTPEGAQDVFAALACKHYAEVCSGSGGVTTVEEGSTNDTVEEGSTNDTVDAGSSAEVVSSAGATGQGSDDDGNELAEPRLRRVESKDGCAVASTPARPFGSRHLGSLDVVAAFGLGLLVRRLGRKRQSKLHN